MKFDSTGYRKGIQKAFFLAGGFLLSSLLTFLLLAFFAFLMLRMDVSANVENIGLILISIFSCFAGGFFCGKKNQSRGFLWGLSVGILYFGMILIIRILHEQNLSEMYVRYITTFFYCAFSGMLGGMLS